MQKRRKGDRKKKGKHEIVFTMRYNTNCVCELSSKCDILCLYDPEPLLFKTAIFGDILGYMML